MTDHTSGDTAGDTAGTQTEKVLPGSYCTAEVRALVAAAQVSHGSVWKHPLRLVDAGMEDLLSAYVLFDINGHRILLLERRNDDGEWAPLLYDTDLQAAPSTARVFGAMAYIDEYADHMTGDLEDLDLVDDANSLALETFCREVLYGVRDLISPNALT